MKKFNISKLTKADVSPYPAYTDQQKSGNYLVSQDQGFFKSIDDTDTDAMLPMDMPEHTVCWISAGELKTAMKFTAKKDVRYYLNGTLIDGKTIVSTNGHYLYQKELVDSAPPHEQAIFPSDALKTLLKQYKKGETITYRYHNGIVQVPFDDGIYQFRCIDMQYPDYKRIIPERDALRVIVPLQTLKTLKAQLKEQQNHDNLCDEKSAFYSVGISNKNGAFLTLLKDNCNNWLPLPLIELFDASPFGYEFNLNAEFLLKFWDGKNELILEPNKGFTAVLVDGRNVLMPLNK